MFGNVPNLYRVPRKVYPQARDMRPGMLFHQVNDGERVLALLNNAQAEITDPAHIFCVVVAASPQSGTLIGSIVPVEFAALVEPLRVEHPMQLSAVA